MRIYRKYIWHMVLSVSGALLIAPLPVLAAAQTDPDEDAVTQPQIEVTRVPAGSLARSSVGEIGQRQSFETIEPMARINSRIQNRVQSRIRNRIDKYYTPQANATSPFEVADDQVRSAGQPRR